MTDKQRKIFIDARIVYINYGLPTKRELGECREENKDDAILVYIDYDLPTKRELGERREENKDDARRNERKRRVFHR